MSDITCIRFIGGEEIIGGVVTSDDTTYTVRDPAGIHMIPNQTTGQMQLGLLPWLPYSDQREFVVMKDKIITVHKPSVDILNNYNRLFGSGIEIASAGSIK